MRQVIDPVTSQEGVCLNISTDNFHGQQVVLLRLEEPLLPSSKTTTGKLKLPAGMVPYVIERLQQVQAALIDADKLPEWELGQ